MFLYFTEQLIGQLSHYELVIPTLVNRKGEFLSYNLEISGDEHEPSTTNRKKRQIFQGPGSGHFWSNYYIHDRVFYKLSAYGNDFHFNLTLNKKLVSSNFVVEYWDKHGVKKQHFDVHRCHFEGFSYQPYKSEAALSNCHGLVSKIKLFFSYFLLETLQIIFLTNFQSIRYSVNCYLDLEPIVSLTLFRPICLRISLALWYKLVFLKWYKFKIFTKISC